MKSYYYIILLLSLVFAACGNRNSGHDHAEHEGHNHATETTVEAHDHATHEGHNHAAETAAKAAADVHDNEAEESAADPDLVVFTPERAERAGVKVAKIERKPFTRAIATFGRITAEAGDAQSVSSPAAGTVTFVVAPVEGVGVKKGQTIALVSSSGMVDGDPVVKAKIAYETAEKEYLRGQTLVKKQIISQREFESIEERYLTAKAAYKGVAQEGSDHAGVAIKSPSDGYIASVEVVEGQYAAMGQRVVGISRGRRMMLTSDLPQRYFKELRNISEARFRLSSDERIYSIGELGGRKISAARSLDGGSFYLPVTFSFNNSCNAVDGEIAEVWLLTTPKPDVTAVPKGALTEEQGLKFVYVRLDEDCYRKTPVKTGASNGSEIEITDGLSGGEEVVVEGAYHVKLASVKGAIPGHSHNH